MQSKRPDIGGMLDRLGGALKQTLQTALREEAERVRAGFVERIKAQRFISFQRVPLSRRWLETKRRLNLDLRTMIATGRYINGIVVREVAHARGVSFQITVEDGSVLWPFFKRKRVPLALLAKVHEFGSAAAHIPARPHWGPYFATLAGRRASLRRALQAAAGRMRRARGGKQAGQRRRP